MGDKALFVMIDDDIDDHEIFNMALQDIDKPLKCLFFSDCESALAHFNSGPVTAPGFVFIDIGLPRINGDECLQQLQQLKEFDNPWIIIYSTSIPAEWKPKLEQIGVDRCIQKTGSIPALVDEIEHLMLA
ncbi:response regulator [Dyadobacter alkalitolerans]|uniref:response regulator n=1 Tax=Dyadobacter alkalitolerans TaxID=492736 RepID=UPI0003FBAC4E|nr:response regulator [Dyadobacter alkalitolerans]